MESCAELVGMTKKINTGKYLHLLSVSFSTEKFLDKPWGAKINIS